MAKIVSQKVHKPRKPLDPRIKRGLIIISPVIFVVFLYFANQLLMSRSKRIGSENTVAPSPSISPPSTTGTIAPAQDTSTSPPQNQPEVDQSPRQNQSVYTHINLDTVADVPLPAGTVVINEFGDAIIADTQGYQIAYYGTDNQFSIGVFSSPFEEGRQKAEDGFLTILNIDQQKACELDVEIVTIEAINPKEAGKEYGLSFCE